VQFIFRKTRARNKQFHWLCITVRKILILLYSVPYRQQNRTYFVTSFCAIYKNFILKFTAASTTPRQLPRRVMWCMGQCKYKRSIRTTKSNPLLSLHAVRIPAPAKSFSFTAETVQENLIGNWTRFVLYCTRLHA